MKPSFNGTISEIPEIAVDNFEPTDRKAYFLSHCHTDHTYGLSQFYPSSDSVFIYMSEISAAIVSTNIAQRLKKFIKPLKLGSSTICIPGSEEYFMEVTLIPAGHCFGSVMFLFKTHLQKVLYTGDFRISENSVSKMAQLHDNDEKPIKLDALYVDTTFQRPRFETFPKRSEIIDGLIHEIREHLALDEKNHVALITSARYGYEDVFNKIYDRLDMKVTALNNWELYSQFQGKLPGVTNSKDTRIHLCRSERRYCEIHTDEYNYLYIKFSALRWESYTPEALTVRPTKQSNYIEVCYATHCSRSELIYFIEYLAPDKVVGFPDKYNRSKEPSIITPTKRNCKSAEKSPNGKKSKKVSENVLRKIFD